MSNKAILELVRRPAVVMHVNARIEQHGKEKQLACDIKLDGIHLEAEELNLLLDDKHAHGALYKSAVKGKPAEPMFRQLKSYELVDKFADCCATIYLGLTDTSIEFEGVKVASVKLTPQVGGLTLMECSVQTEIEDTDDVARLLEVLHSEGSVELLIGAKEIPKGRKAQKSLDLAPTAGKTADAPAAAADGEAGAVH